MTLGRHIPTLKYLVLIDDHPTVRTDSISAVYDAIRDANATSAHVSDLRNGATFIVALVGSGGTWETIDA